MNITKNYLTLGEIKSIIAELREIDDVVDRMFTKDMLVIKYCTDIEVGDTIDSGTYDTLIVNGNIDEIKAKIVNYGIVDELIDKQDTLDNSLNKRLESLDIKVGNFLISLEKTLAKFEKKLPKDMKNLKFDEVFNLIGGQK